MQMAVIRSGATRAVTSRRASVVASHHWLASCPAQPGTGVSSASGARLSVTGTPWASQATALQAVVEQSIPRTRSAGTIALHWLMLRTPAIFTVSSDNQPGAAPLGQQDVGLKCQLKLTPRVFPALSDAAGSARHAVTGSRNPVAKTC